MKVCAQCGGSMVGRSSQATYCAQCRDDRRKTAQRVAGPAPCPCGSSRVPARRFCAICIGVRDKARQGRYASSPKGKANFHRYTSKPSTKIRRAEYADEHVEAIRGYKRKYAQRLLRRGSIKICASEGCGGRFSLGFKGGSRKFCATCQETFYGAHYVRRLDARRSRTAAHQEVAA